MTWSRTGAGSTVSTGSYRRITEANLPAENSAADNAAADNAAADNTDPGDSSERQPSPTITISWTEWEDTVLTLDEIVGLVDWQREVDAVIDEIRTELPINGELLSALMPLITGEEEWVELNGHKMFPRIHASGGWVLIPESPERIGAEMITSASAAWLAGGPCEFNQGESLWRLGGFHWVEAWGDMEDLVIAVGDLGDPDMSLSAAVGLSHWFSFDDDGEIVSELDEIPDPYFEDENESEAEREARSDRSYPSGFDASTPRPVPVARPYGTLRCVARFNVTDPVRFANGVQRLLPAGLNIKRYDRGEATDRFESSGGETWSVQRPDEVLLLWLRSMPTVGTELDGWEPRVRAEDLAGWTTVYELVIQLDEFDLRDPKLRERWRPQNESEEWQPQTLLRHLHALTGATMLQLELRGKVIE